MLCSVHQDNSFELSKTFFGQFIKLFIIKGVEGVQNLPNVRKKVKKNSEKKNSLAGGKMEQENGW